MEIVSPLTFAYTFFHAPLSPTGTTPPLSLTHPPTLLAALFIAHYLNRAIISPLRTPARSKSHVIVPLCAVFFNVVNGALMGSYLSSPAAASFLTSPPRPSFYIGLGLWAAGFAGNILHDEILLNLRRTTQKEKSEDPTDKKPHYAIPYGWLYNYISYPNYFCEWVEWFGFALAAAPDPFSPASHSFAALTTAAPPWLFFFSEVLLMLPRAYKGHQWYHAKFPDYPKERNVVVPFLF